jgi:hypothetical protein
MTFVRQLNKAVSERSIRTALSAFIGERIVPGRDFLLCCLTPGRNLNSEQGFTPDKSCGAAKEGGKSKTEKCLPDFSHCFFRQCCLIVSHSVANF